MDRPTVIRAKIARATQMGVQPEVIEAMRADYYAARAHDYLRDWLASDPRPTTAHRAELAALLLDGGADAAA